MSATIFLPCFSQDSFCMFLYAFVSKVGVSHEKKIWWHSGTVCAQVAGKVRVLRGVPGALAVAAVFCVLYRC